MRKLSLIMLLALLAGAAPASAQINEILKRVSAHRDALTSLRANLTFESKYASLGETTVSKGNLVAIMGKSPLIRVDLPDERRTLLVIDEKFAMYDARASILYRANLRGVDVAVQGDGPYSWLSMLFGRSKTLKALGNIDYLGQEVIGATSVFHLRAIPRTDAEIVRTDLWYDTDGFLVQFKTTRRNGDESTAVLTKPVKNKQIDKQTLKLTVPKDARNVTF